MAVSDAQKRASARYAKANVKSKAVRFYPRDRDLLEWLDGMDEPFGAYVRRLIREDMERHGRTSPRVL